MKDLPLDNDFEFQYAVTRKNAATGLSEPATGLAGLTCRISLTDAGAAISGPLTVNAVERSNAQGVYFGVFQGDDLRTSLATQIGKVVYEVFGDGVNVFSSEPRRVVGIRRP